MTAISSAGLGTYTQTGGQQHSASHTVERGDTLSSIAARHGVSIDQLLASNPQLLNPNHLYPGDQIVVPGGASAGGAAAAGASAGASAASAPAGGGSASNMSLSQEGLNLIKQHEGLRTTGYADPVGIPTIGYGHTGPDVQVGQQITEAQAEQYLRQDVGWAEDAVRQNVKVPITQGQFDALVSFTYNLGPTGMAKSSVLEKLNAGDYAGAQAEFGKYVHAGGSVLPGLVRRRAEEAQLFGNQKPDGADASADLHKKKGDGPVKDGPSTDGNLEKVPPNATGDGNREKVPSNTYTVKPGDTLWDIAQAHNVDLADLIAANGHIENPDLIFPGQQINIPGGKGDGRKPLDGSNGSGSATGGGQAVDGGSAPAGAAPAGNGTGANAAAIADSFVGQNAADLKQSGALPMNPSVPNDVCCANFVSAVLIKNGQLSQGEHTSWVPQLETTLRNKGWKQVDISQAKPGDVVIMNNQGHTEIVVKNENGKLTLVGSNNSNPDGSQRIGYDDGSWAGPLTILTPP